jgi:hypothetical protein
VWEVGLFEVRGYHKGELTDQLFVVFGISVLLRAIIYSHCSGVKEDCDGSGSKCLRREM